MATTRMGQTCRQENGCLRVYASLFYSLGACSIATLFFACSTQSGCSGGKCRAALVLVVFVVVNDRARLAFPQEMAKNLATKNLKHMSAALKTVAKRAAPTPEKQTLHPALARNQMCVHVGQKTL